MYRYISVSVRVASCMRMIVRYVQPQSQRCTRGRSWVVAVEVARPAETEVQIREGDATYACARAVWDERHEKR